MEMFLNSVMSLILLVPEDRIKSTDIEFFGSNCQREFTRKIWTNETSSVKLNLILNSKTIISSMKFNRLTNLIYVVPERAVILINIEF